MGWYNCYDYVKVNGNNANAYKISDGANIDNIGILFHGNASEFAATIGGISGAYSFPQGTYETLSDNQKYEIIAANGSKIYMRRYYDFGDCIAIGYNLPNDASNHDVFSTGSWNGYWSNAIISVMFFYSDASKTVLQPLIVSYNTSGYTAWQGYETNMSKERTDLITGGGVVIPYTWKSWLQLSGNAGMFLMDLSTIDDEVIGDGRTAYETFDNTKFNLNSLTDLYTMTINLLNGQETTIAYCGDNYLTATKRTTLVNDVTTVYVTLKFYFRSS